MNISLEKWLVMALLTVVSIFLGLIPYFIVRHTNTLLSADSVKYKIILTILSCFGGGVLFSTSMLHLLPEVRSGLQANPNIWNTLDDHFPLAEVVVIAGFCLIYLVEEVAHFIMVDGHHGHNHNMNSVARHNSLVHAVPIPNIKGYGSTLATPRSSIVTLAPSSRLSIPNNNDGVSYNNDLTAVVYPSEEKLPTIEEGDTKSLSSANALDEECPDDQNTFTSSLRTFLALIALSFHAIMEGVTIGLQNSSNVWVMFGAVASHKFVISFCMGMELVASQTKPLTYFSSIVFFAVISPVGIIIGSLLSSEDSAENLAVKIVEGLACGTLLYVVFFEILNRERERKSYSMSNSKAVGFIQFAALVVGLVGMGCLVTLTHNEHDSKVGEGSDDGHNH